MSSGTLAGRVRTASRAEDLRSAETPDTPEDSAPLPAAPTTGWEAPYLFAAPLVREPEPFLWTLKEANLPLAGECAALIRTRRPRDPSGSCRPRFLDDLRWALVARCGDTGADLRARIAAGHALGALGDPRYDRHVSPDGVEYLLPPMATIPAGTYTIGSDTDHENERPRRAWQLDAPIRLSCFQVANAEWALFMKAGGYEDTRWWPGEAAARWQAGVGTDHAPRAGLRATLSFIRESGGVDALVSGGLIDRMLADDWRKFEDPAQDPAFQAWIEHRHPGGPVRQPYLWVDARYRGASQPVVGICLYEADAYALWLSAASGLTFRLPSEREWEAAARGRTARRFPWGDGFDATRANTREGRVHATTPVGVFPAGVTPGSTTQGGGVADLAGNVWEWTSSRYTPDRYSDVTRAMRNADLLSDGEGMEQWRVVRGGSWTYERGDARASCRIEDHPGARSVVVGCRLVCVSPIRR